MYDAIVVGGGPAGLSAALLLARSRRRVLLCDAGKQRNRFSDAMHGYLTRDGISPAEFLRIAYDEVLQYGVEVKHCTVKAGQIREHGFTVTLEDDTSFDARKLLIATGVQDQLPAIPNIDAFYGKSVHHCPYCDGWEHRDGRIAVYASKPGLAFSMKTWSSDVVLLTDGPARFTGADRKRLDSLAIRVVKRKIARLEGKGSRMTHVVFDNGESLARDALFFSTGQHQACSLVTDLGCILNNKGTVDTNRMEMSEIPGLYVAGDASKDVQLVIVAAAEGAKAAIAINTALQNE